MILLDIVKEFGAGIAGAATRLVLLRIVNLD
jgi:hypothetical protein